MHVCPICAKAALTALLSLPVISWMFVWWLRKFRVKHACHKKHPETEKH